MATKAESVHAREQRHGLTPRARKRGKAKKTGADRLGAAHESKRAGAKATYAQEAPSKSGRASRKSTRGSANRSKPDTNLVLRAERKVRAPTSRARRARARATRVRGSSTA